jgi:hypothetical protein
MARAQGRSRKASDVPFERPPSELVIIANNADAPIRRRDVTESTEVESHLRDILPPSAEVSRVFGSPNRLQSSLQGTEQEDFGTELLNYFTVPGDATELESLAETLRDDDAIAYAFVKPPAEPPIAPPGEGEEAVRAMPGPAEDAPPVTPDFTARQGYLEAAPTGVDARWAWTRPGGKGNGIRVIDIEGAWRFTHEDLIVNQGGVIGGTSSTDIGWRNHGTAVAGEIGGDENTYGITGIAPNAVIRAVSIFGGPGSAGALRIAADALSAGDVILIELHRPGPLHNFASRSDQEGYIAIEWWPDDFAAIRYAIGRGVVVVEAAGNGQQNYDTTLYDTRPAGFPASWQNPLRATGPDSGAIVVGAGAPPPGTHGRDHGPARSRLGFSNYGSRVDAQGWGREVTTAGYGELQGGANEDLWYTDVFSGTSSASPIVVGAVAAYQGISAASTGRKTPAQIRSRLRTTGSAQQDAPSRPVSQRIGNLPDLRALVGIKNLKEVKNEKIEIKENKNEKLEIKEVKREKNEIKENKNEIKENKNEKLETKELKREKPETKELKREKIEIKDKNEKIEIHEKERDIFRGQGYEDASGQSGAASTEDRLAALEQTVSQLNHFIVQSLRPDLGAGALGYDEGFDAGDGENWQEL